MVDTLVESTTNVTINADSNADGTGIVRLRTRGTDRFAINNDGMTRGFHPLELPGGSESAPALTLGDAATGWYRTQQMADGSTDTSAYAWALAANDPRPEISTNKAIMRIGTGKNLARCGND
jgi:hypothetical protein